MSLPITIQGREGSSLYVNNGREIWRYFFPGDKNPFGAGYEFVFFVQAEAEAGATTRTPLLLSIVLWPFPANE